MNSMLPSWVVDIATIATILGFFLTIMVWYQVKWIKLSYKNKARLPEIHLELSECASKINGYLNDWDNQERMAIAEMTACKGLLDNLSLKSNSTLKKSASKLKLKISGKSSWYSFKALKMNSDLAWDIYGELTSLNNLLGQTIKDSKWE